jgi:beta-glucosidase
MGGLRFGSLVAIVAASLAIVAGPASAATGPCSEPSGRPWCDPSLSPDKRAGLLVAALTEDEKISLLSGATANGHTGATAAVPRVGLTQSYNTDGPVGIRQGSATAMPTPMGLAATFDRSMAHLYGQTLGNEARAKGNDGILAPTINMMRTPLNGRTFEAFGEDPFLVASTTTEWVKGAQSQGIYATPKHFAANNQEGVDVTGQTGQPGTVVGGAQQNPRYTENSIVDDRTLHEIYLPQFEAAVKAGAGSVMCSYNRLNGPWACSNGTLLQKILEGQWGFKGFVMSDWVFATHPFDTISAINNGLDLEMPFPDAYTPGLVKAALATGQTSEAVIDEHVRRMMRTLFAVGFFDRASAEPDDGLIDKSAHAAAAQHIEESAITLLKNDGALPLDASKLKSLAVIGPDATKFVTGGGSGNVTPFSVVTALDGIKARAGSGVKVTSDDGSDAGAAAESAKAADAAVVVVGDYETEGADRQCLTLECPSGNGDQDALIEAVAAAQPNTIVVLETGGPVLTPWRDKVKGLVEAWYPGESGGTAIARVLFGDVDPGGRLPVTFPEKEADEPTAGDTNRYPGDASGDVHYDEGVLMGYRWFDAKHLTPAYPFGFGLSYTSWRYRHLSIKPAGSGAKVSFDVTNTGSRAGTEVPQLYLSLPQPSSEIVQPPLQLKGYRKVSLAPGKTRRVTLAIGARALSYWDTPAQRWAVAPGCYGVDVGHSSRGIVLSGTLPVHTASCGGPVGLPSSRRCKDRRKFSFKLHHAPHARVVRVAVFVNGKRKLSRRGRDIKRVTLRRLPRGRFEVRVVATQSSGSTLTSTRTYKGCNKSRPTTRAHHHRGG